MRCPRCDAEIELAWQAIRKARRVLHQCVDCGSDAGRYWRCLKCRQKVAGKIAFRRAEQKKVVQRTPISPDTRSI